jgi:hypothetical protein
MEKYLEEARQLAAQCWCDEETKDIPMEPALAEAVARRIAAWMDTAAFHANNEEFYRNLIDQCVDSLGPVKEQAFRCDDGSISESPLRLSVPSCVAELAKKLQEAEAKLSERS